MSSTVSRSTAVHLRAAATHLFGSQAVGKAGFFARLNLDQVKHAYRNKAFHVHPDRAPHRGSALPQPRPDEFIRLKHSYDILKDYLEARERPVPLPSLGKKRIIAVGGAKGGIGKSLFSANLSVLLQSLGLKTTLVDLDLGGANLHLYCGAISLDHNLNDVLQGAVPTLEDIMIPTKFGPTLIGGDSSLLGTANLSFNLKRKLIKMVKGLAADVIILDLGGDTSFNILDFFLAADVPLVLTTADPASYLQAYNFIKVALYRRLNRLFDDSGGSAIPKNHELRKLIFQATLGSSDQQMANTQELLARVRRLFPDYVPFLNRQINAFQPYLVINMSTDDILDAQVVSRIQQVADRMLRVNVRYVGAIPYSEDIRDSARTLVPVVSRHPRGPLATTLHQIARKIL